jgi:hypothetical protein
VNERGMLCPRQVGAAVVSTGDHIPDRQTEPFAWLAYELGRRYPDTFAPRPAAEHRFTGMRPELSDDGMSYVGWYGTCACGHAETPAPDKTTAWQEIAAHFVPLIEHARLIDDLEHLLGGDLR